MIVADKKTQTTRVPADLWKGWYEHHPKSGQQVKAEGPDGWSCRVRITEVMITTLGEVATRPEHYTREGYETGQGFIDGWREVYHRFDPQLLVCVLRFVRVVEAHSYRKGLGAHDDGPSIPRPHTLGGWP